MSKVLIAILALAGIGLLVEYSKRGKKTPTSTLGDDQRMRTAAEEGPTETGRFKVQEMLRNTESFDEESGGSKTKEASTPDDEEELPDPFERN